MNKCGIVVEPGVGLDSLANRAYYTIKCAMHIRGLASGSEFAEPTYSQRREGIVAIQTNDGPEIAEVGIAILYTEELLDIPLGMTWEDLIRYHHAKVVDEHLSEQEPSPEDNGLESVKRQDLTKWLADKINSAVEPRVEDTQPSTYPSDSLLPPLLPEQSPPAECAIDDYPSGAGTNLPTSDANLTLDNRSHTDTKTAVAVAKQPCNHRRKIPRADQSPGKACQDRRSPKCKGNDAYCFWCRMCKIWVCRKCWQGQNPHHGSRSGGVDDPRRRQRRQGGLRPGVEKEEDEDEEAEEGDLITL